VETVPKYGEWEAIASLYVAVDILNFSLITTAFATLDWKGK
jgi:hypothetical protein